jgi:hypothetical protein
MPEEGSIGLADEADVLLRIHVQPLGDRRPMLRNALALAVHGGPSGRVDQF